MQPGMRLALNIESRPVSGGCVRCCTADAPVSTGRVDLAVTND
jgi:hypothetical protein